MAVPHDITDLYLAPVALGIDDEIQRLDQLSEEKLLLHVVLVTDREPRTLAERRSYFIDAVTRYHDLHGWVVSWDPRGLRVSHDEHTLVLGLPPNVSAFLAEPARA